MKDQKSLIMGRSWWILILTIPRELDVVSTIVDLDTI